MYAHMRKQADRRFSYSYVQDSRDYGEAPYLVHWITVGRWAFYSIREVEYTVVYPQKNHFYLCPGILCGQPSLSPSSNFSCPNETVTFTCHASQIANIQWIMEPYVLRSSPIIYSVGLAHTSAGSGPINRSEIAFATLINITTKRGNNEIGWRGDMTTILTINTAGVENKTTITCLTQTGIDFFSSSTTLYIAGWISLQLYNKCVCVSYSYIIYRCALPEDCPNHLPTSRDKFYSCIATSRYVWWRRSSNWSLHYSRG